MLHEQAVMKEPRFLVVPQPGAKPLTSLPGVPLRRVGPTVIIILAAAYALYWLLVRPAGEPAAGYVGQLFGGESVLLLSIALVLISTLPQVEHVFGGIDHAAIWHRRAAITGTVSCRAARSRGCARRPRNPLFRFPCASQNRCRRNGVAIFQWLGL